MTSWVLSIDEDHPQHWDYARDAGFWDLRTSRNIQAGDLVYFWQTKGSFVGRVRATSDVYPIDGTVQPPGPWDDWPGTYEARFQLTVLDSRALASPKWGDFAAQVSGFVRPDWAPRFTDPGEEAVLASSFAPLTGVERAMLALLDEDLPLPDFDLDALAQDERRVVEQLRAVRDGQNDFRRRLEQAYPGCAISGTTVPLALEAAHIHPYRGPKTHDVRNGMLLRRDLHKLFDAHMLTVSGGDNFVVHVSPALKTTDYWQWDGQPLRNVPTRKSYQPAQQLLAVHNGACGWFAR